MDNIIKKILNAKASFLIILVIVIFCVYGKSINYELLEFDDVELIRNNKNLVLNVYDIPNLFLTDCYFGNEVPYYRPILNLSFVIEHLIFGYNTKIYHVTNIILFIFSIYLICLFLIKLKLNRNIVYALCLLLAIHPVLTSCCVWIAARNDTLLLIFSILSILNLIVYNQKCKFRNLLVATLFFALSLFTKETSIISLIMFPLFFYVFEYKFSRKQIINMVICFFLATLIYFVFRNIASIRTDFIDCLYHLNIICSNSLNGLILYIDNIVIPVRVPIMLFNPLISIYEISIILIIILLTIYFVYKKIVKGKTVVFGFLWFIMYLIPTFFISENQIFFHRLLLPFVGLIIILSVIIQQISTKYLLIKKYFVFVWIIFFILYFFLSYKQSDKYKDSENFYLNAYIDAPTYYKFIAEIGKMYSNIGEYDKALEYLYLAEYKWPNNYLVEIAIVLCYQNKIDEAEELLNKSIAANKYKDICYGNLSSIYENKKDYQKALEYALKAYKINPRSSEFSVNLARIYRLNNEFEKAIEIYDKLLKHDMKNPQYLYSLGILYNDINDKNNALKFLNKAIEFDPKNEKYNKKTEELKNALLLTL